MVTITRATISNTFPIFIRDVLRYNLVDTQSPARTSSNWILKEQPEDFDYNSPVVIVEMVEEKATKINFDGSKMHTPPVSVMITIWARKMEDRDNLMNQIKNILLDVDSTDSNLTSIKGNHLAILEYTTRVRTRTLPNFPKLIREGSVTINYEYLNI